MYRLLGRLFPTRPAPDAPRRIVLIRPCCIGDVVLATAALRALRDRYPDAHITWAISEWAQQALNYHDLVDRYLVTGPGANPASLPFGVLRFARQLRRGKFDLAISLVRSPLMSLAIALSGVPHRVGLDSDGRGFGYTLRVPVDPTEPRHEAEIYLDVTRALGIASNGYYASVPVHDLDRRRARQIVGYYRYFVINPAGGVNPGMSMISKRYPPEQFARLATRLAQAYDAKIVLIGGPGDSHIVSSVRIAPSVPSVAFVGQLSFGEIAALANQALAYIGNDTGLTHLAAAAGARTVMILGPSDPARYAPFTPDSLALWKESSLSKTGVHDASAGLFNWERDGIDVDEAFDRIREFVDARL